MVAVIDHVTLQVADVASSRGFYATLLAPLGLRDAYQDDGGVGFAENEAAPFWLCPATSIETREVHLAFAAASRDVVDPFHLAAQALGAGVLHPPREFPEYGSGYYACFVRDPDGHNVEAVCRA